MGLNQSKMVAQAIQRPSSLPDMRRRAPQGEGAPPQPSYSPSIRALGRGTRGFQNNLSSREGRRGGTYESSRACPLPVSPPPPGGQERSRKESSGFKHPSQSVDPLPKTKPLEKGVQEGASPTSPGRAESRRGARHRADPAAAPGSGGQTWQRPGSAATTCGYLPPSGAAPPPHALRTHPGHRGALPHKPARVDHKQSQALRAQSAHRPPGRASPLREDAKKGGRRREEEARKGAPRSRRGRRPRPYLDRKAK